MTVGIDRRRRILIGASVATTAILAVVAWLLLNFVLTRPGLRTSFDLTRNAQFTISPATEDLIAALREDEGKKLEIHTFFIPARDLDAWRVSIQSRILRLTRDLLERLSYLGGDGISVTHHDIKGEIGSLRDLFRGLGAQPNSVVLSMGKRRRVLDLWRDMADVRFPDSQRAGPGQMAIPVLEGYRGESAFASVLSELLSEGTPVVYSLTNHGEMKSQDPSGRGCQTFSILLRNQGLKFVEWDLEMKGEIPNDCAVLLILQPGRIATRETTLIRSYLSSGGRVLLTLGHPRGVSFNPAAPMRLDDLLGPYGIEVGDAWLLNGIPQGRDVAIGSEFVMRVQIRKGLNDGHPVTHFLRRNQSYVDLIGARSLKFKKPMPDGVVGEYLLTTNPYTWKANLTTWPEPEFYGPQSELDYGTHHVAGIVEITTGTGRSGRLVVISGLAFANGDKLIQDNEVFATKLVDWLARRKSLVSVPSANYRSQAMRVSPVQLARVGWLVYSLPVLFLALAVFVVFWRRRA